MDILWNSVYGNVWEKIDTDDIYEALDHILDQFPRNSPETVMTQTASVITNKATDENPSAEKNSWEDAETILTVTFLHWSNHKTFVSVTHIMTKAGGKEPTVSHQIMCIEHSGPDQISHQTLHDAEIPL